MPRTTFRTVHQNPHSPLFHSMISLPNPTSELMTMIDTRTSADGVPTELTNTQWLQRLPQNVLSKVNELNRDEGYPLDDIREFIEEFGYNNFISGYYETWAELTDHYDNEAIEAFVEDNGIENIESFEDAYCGQYGDIREAVEMLLEIYEVDVPDFVVIDYERTWEANLRHDYTFEGGFLFNRNF